MKKNFEEIKESLETANKIENMADNYKALCDILEIQLNVKLNLKKPKNFDKPLQFKIERKTLNYLCTFESYKYEVDSTGKIKEKLHVKKGKISFVEGINSLIKYVNLKNEKNPEAEKLLDNTFKCPIIYKNFDGDEIPENQTLITEIKSGFDICSVKKQLEERIKVIKKCLFNEDEKPKFFVGIINLDSKNVNKLSELLHGNFELEENALIISLVDFEFFGFDLSYEINNDYLLFKKLEETRNDMNAKFEMLDKKIDKIDSKFESLKKKIEELFDVIEIYGPKINNAEKPFKKEDKNEERKGDS